MLDPSAVEAQLEPREAAAALGFPDVRAPERIRGGWDTLLWRFATPDAREHALRVYVLREREAMARRERLALEACARAGLPAPRVEAAGRHQGLPALVLSWCPGETLYSRAERQPWLLGRVGRLLGRAQARVHRVSPPAELVADAPDAWLARVPAGYERLAERARSHALACDALVHLDLHPLNVICEGQRVTGVIDWSNAGAGDRRADLARTAATLLAAPAPPSFLRPVLELARRVLLRGWRAGYQELAGPMPDYRPLLAWAGAALLWELEPALGRADVWETERDIETLRARIARWEREADAT